MRRPCRRCRRAVAALVTGAAAFALTSCGGSDGDDDMAQAGPTTIDEDAPPPNRCELLDGDELAADLGLALEQTTQLSETGCTWQFERGVDVTVQVLPLPDQCDVLLADSQAEPVVVAQRAAVVVSTPTQVAVSVCRDDEVATLVVAGRSIDARDELAVSWASVVERR